jgi:uroporphyrinogen-III synthase
MRIWVTRTQPGAEQTADKLRALGHEPIVQPVLEAQPIAGSDLDLSQADFLAFTSGQAVTAFAERTDRRDLMVFVVGDGTAARARQAGFTDVCSAEGDIGDLTGVIALIVSETGGIVVWPCAEEPAGDLTSLLKAEGVTCIAQPIYRTVETATSAPTELDAVLIHSPRGARCVARGLATTAAAKLALYAISEKAAEPLKNHPFHHVAIAPRPNETALLDLITG